MAKLTTRKRIVIGIIASIITLFIFIVAWAKLTKSQFLIFVLVLIVVSIILEPLITKKRKQ